MAQKHWLTVSFVLAVAVLNAVLTHRVEAAQVGKRGASAEGHHHGRHAHRSLISTADPPGKGHGRTTIEEPDDAMVQEEFELEQQQQQQQQMQQRLGSYTGHHARKRRSGVGSKKKRSSHDHEAGRTRREDRHDRHDEEEGFKQQRHHHEEALLGVTQHRLLHRNKRRGAVAFPLPPATPATGDRAPPGGPSQQNPAALLKVKTKTRTFPEILKDGDDFARNFVADDDDFVLEQQVKRERDAVAKQHAIALQADLAERMRVEKIEHKRQRDEEMAQRSTVRRWQKSHAQAAWARKALGQQEAKVEALSGEAEKARQQMASAQASSARVKAHLQKTENATREIERQEVLLEEEQRAEESALRRSSRATREASDKYREKSRDLEEAKEATQTLQAKLKNYQEEAARLGGGLRVAEEALKGTNPAIIAADVTKSSETMQQQGQQTTGQGAVKHRTRQEPEAATEAPTAGEESEAANGEEKPAAEKKKGLLGEALKKEVEAEEQAEKNQAGRRTKATVGLSLLLAVTVASALVLFSMICA